MDDVVVCVLRGGFTTVERTLIDEGRADAVHEIRRTFESAMEDQFTGVVEEITGRRVAAFMSELHVDPDIAVQIFILEPGEEGAPPPG